MDLTQEVLRTTGRAPDPSGGARDSQGRVLKFAWPTRGIPRSARGRARARSRDLNLDSGKSLAISNIFFQKSRSRKSEKWVVRRIQFWIQPIWPIFDSGHPVRTRDPTHREAVDHKVQRIRLLACYMYLLRTLTHVPPVLSLDRYSALFAHETDSQ